MSLNASGFDSLPKSADHAERGTHSLKSLKLCTNSIYDEFERQAATWKREALCSPGCSFCCTHFGNVDVTTLEGMAIRDFTMSLPDAERTPLRAIIALNREFKLSSRPAPCLFLVDDQICRIYPIRPLVMMTH